MTALFDIRRYSILSLIILPILLAFACSSSPEKETKRWQENQTRNQDYQTRYPTMQAVLKSDKVAANGMWAQALKVTDAKAQVEAMKKANLYISEIPSKLSSIESRLNEASRKVKELSRIRLNLLQDQSRDRKIQDLQKTVDQVNAALRRDPQVEHVATLTYLRNLNTRLSSTVTRARNMLTKFRKSKSKKRAKAKAKAKSKSRSKSKSKKSK
jgi:hypothetical protein